MNLSILVTTTKSVKPHAKALLQSNPTQGLVLESGDTQLTITTPEVRFATVKNKTEITVTGWIIEDGEKRQISIVLG